MWLYRPYEILPVGNNQAFTCHIKKKKTKGYKKEFSNLFYIARNAYVTHQVVKNKTEEQE